jgi:predicted DNA binding protein
LGFQEFNNGFSMIQLAFRLKRDWDLIKLTEENPSITILDWCNFNIDFYELRTTNGQDLEPLSRAFLGLRKKLGFILQRKIPTGPNANIFIMTCKHRKKGSIEETMHRSSCLPLQPFVFHRGWLKINSVSLDAEKLSGMFARLGKLGEVEIDSKREMNIDSLSENLTIPTSAFVSNLTAKQAESILTAIEHGYYQVPRQTRFEDISRALSVPRTTYEEHARKAESKIMNALAPYLSIYFEKSKVAKSNSISGIILEKTNGSVEATNDGSF